MTSTFATSITVGTTYRGIANSYPFTVPAIGGTFDYEQIYSSTAFSGPITFNTITFFDTQIPGAVVASGNYDITFSYTSSPLNSDYPVAGTWGTQTFFDGVLGGPTGTSFSISGTPFVYDPSLGNLLIDVYVTDQAIGSGSGGFDRDGFTSVVSRAWAGYSDNSGLVTQFLTAVWERLTNDTGSNSDHITNDPSLTGSGVANAVVHFTVDGSPISDTATADGSGMWDFTPIGLGQGGHTIVASETDTAGNTRTASLTFTLDTIAPSNVITSDVLNKNGSFTLTGTSEGNSTIQIYDGSTLLGLTVPNSGGQWSFTTETLSKATAHNFNSTATDVAGNVGSSGAAVYGTKGNDAITGSAGNDLLTGGGGSDTFVFSNAVIGKDVITDFQATGLSHDTLQFDHSIFANAADVLAHATQVGKDVVINYDATDMVTLTGVHLNQLTANDFDIV
jgi:hypothetical protein